MEKTSHKELLAKIRTELNEEIAWLSHHIEWLNNELKNGNSSYYEGLRTAYKEVKADLTRISNRL